MAAEKVETPWEDPKDLLKRKEDAQFLKNFLLAQPEKRKELGYTGSYVLNINAEWGYGKTYFLENFARDLRKDGYLVAEVNAWEDDHSADPFLSVLTAINTSISNHYENPESGVIKKSFTEFGKGLLSISSEVAQHQIKRYVGTGLDDLVALFRNNPQEEETDALLDDVSDKTEAEISKRLASAAKKIISGFEQDKKNHKSFKESLSSILQNGLNNSVSTPLFVFVDELDRCRPLYAIELLERIKHLFDIPDVIFVLATDTQQLSCSVKAVYGQDFDAPLYLKRFFNRTYAFSDPDIEDFVRYRLKRRNMTLEECICHPIKLDLNEQSPPELETKISAMAAICKTYGLQLRDIEQCIEILDVFISGWPYKDPEYKIHLGVLFPQIIAFHKMNKEASITDAIKLLETTRAEDKSKTYVEFKTPIVNSSGRQNIVSKDLGNYLDAYRQNALDIRKSVNQQRPHTFEAAINNVFRVEAAHKRQTHNSDTPIRSVLLDYPKFIAQAGRLSVDIAPIKEQSEPA